MDRLYVSLFTNNFRSFPSPPDLSHGSASSLLGTPPPSSTMILGIVSRPLPLSCSRLNLVQSSPLPALSCLGPPGSNSRLKPSAQHHNLEYSTGSDLLLILLGSDLPLILLGSDLVLITPRRRPPAFVFLYPRLRPSYSSILASGLRIPLSSPRTFGPRHRSVDLLVLFKLSINPTVPCPNSLSKYSTLPNPTPCSPLHVPSNSMAR
jgi:hypothetical protein